MNYKYMNMAFEMAMIAYNEGEVPIGAVIVKNDKVIAKAYNIKEQVKCCLGHAEILAIRDASKVLNNWRLDDCDLYVTLDPCPMCASAIKQARIKNVYSAISNSDKNNKNVINTIFSDININNSVNFVSNIDIERGSNILRTFFTERRKK